MVKDQIKAKDAKHDAMLEVYSITAKIELLDDLIESSTLKSEKDKLEEDLRRAERKLSSVKVSEIDWLKLRESFMYD